VRESGLGQAAAVGAMIQAIGCTTESS
jgi:hypothetical protein